jgi:hypothetical protein
VQTFEIAFASRYLDNLHRHLAKAKPTPAWEAVYRGIDIDTATVTGTLVAALNAHLIDDLPEALHASDVRTYHVADFFTLSRLIWRTAPPRRGLTNLSTRVCCAASLTVNRDSAPVTSTC